MYLELCRDRVSILTALVSTPNTTPPGREFRRDSNDKGRGGITSDSQRADGRSGGVDRHASRVLAATLLTVSKNPAVLHSRASGTSRVGIACDYQRTTSPQGALARRLGRPGCGLSGEIEQPTDVNIAKAAGAAIVSLQKTRKAGRSTIALIEFCRRLGDIFRRSGQPVRRAASRSCAKASWSTWKAVRSTIFFSWF